MKYTSIKKSFNVLFSCVKLSGGKYIKSKKGNVIHMWRKERKIEERKGRLGEKRPNNRGNRIKS